MRKIVFFEVGAWEKAWLVQHLGGFELRFSESALDEHHLPAEHDAAVLSVGEHSVVSGTVLAHFPRTELVAVRGRECSTVDFATCRDRKALVCRVPYAAAHAVAEFTIALMLSLTRKVCAAAGRGKSGSNSTDRLRGVDLHGKVLGVLGVGSIGSAVIRIARAFGMRVLAWGRKENLQLAAELGFAYTSFDAVLAHADVLTLHVPYVPAGKAGATHHLMDRNAFSCLKRDCRQTPRVIHRNLCIFHSKT